MVICPRCQRSVDETKWTSCPICYERIVPEATAPVQSAETTLSPAASVIVPPSVHNYAPNSPQLQYPLEPLNAPHPSQVQQAEHLARPSVIPFAYGTGGNSTAPRPAALLMDRHTTPMKASRTGTIVGLFTVLTLLSCSFGWWYLWDQRQKPKRQAIAVFTAMMKQDWKAVYPLIIVSDELKREAPTAEIFARGMSVEMQDGMRANQKIAYGSEIMKTITDVHADDAIIDGDKADVPIYFWMTKMHMRYEMKGSVRLINESGIWKCDMYAENCAENLMGRPVPNTLMTDTGIPIYK